MPLDHICDKSTLVQVTAWCHQATSHYLSQCWPRSLSPYGVTRPQWVNIFLVWYIIILISVYLKLLIINQTNWMTLKTFIQSRHFEWVCPFNSLWSSDGKWWHRSGSTLALVMVCCLIAPSHYLNQCHLLISEVLWRSPVSNSIAHAQATILYNEIENYTFERLPYLPGGNELNWFDFLHVKQTLCMSLCI